METLYLHGSVLWLVRVEPVVRSVGDAPDSQDTQVPTPDPGDLKYSQDSQDTQVPTPDPVDLKYSQIVRIPRSLPLIQETWNIVR